MLIKRNYNVKSLAETLEGALSVALDDGKIVVEIGLLEASEILDVLNETNKREQKHQTLESACNFMEMEDGTQTNEMELHEKMTKMPENLQKANGAIPDCYGKYYDNGLRCIDCKSRESCVEETINRKDIEEDDDFI